MSRQLYFLSFWRQLPLLFICSLLFSYRIPYATAFAAAANQNRPPSSPSSTTSPDNKNIINNQLLRLGNSLQKQKGVILVDVENVRGKSGFALSHKDLMEQLSHWTNACQIAGQVILMADHGNSKDAYWTDDNLAIVFSGNAQKADDVMAHDIGKIAQWTNEWNGYQVNDKRTPIIVVTDDQGLLSRCRKTTARKSLQVVTPLSLLEELEQLREPTMDANASKIVQDSSKQITMAAEWMMAHSKIKAIQHKHVPNKRRKALNAGLKKWQHQLEATDLGTTIYRYAKGVMEGNQDDQSTTLHPELQAAIVAAWERLRDTIRNTKFQKEKTGDRVVLAEDFRSQLSKTQEQSTQALLKDSDEVSLLPAQRYVRHWSWTHMSVSSMSNNTNNTLKLVVISDTHGFEEDLPPLPKGDVLLHLGDFALEGPGKDLALTTLDQWLAKQPHPHKIVLRGNHDPRSLYFDCSGALFVTSPRTVTLGGFSIALVPFLSRVTAKCLPTQCDAVASHVPPKGILDKCTSGQTAGCNALKKRLQHMNQAPKVVVCGHIHESRGWVHHNFGKTDDDKDNDTLVLNVANANPGIAERIDHGPVMVQLSRQEGDVQVDFTMAEDVMAATEPSPLWELYEECNGNSAGEPLKDKNGASWSTEEVLLTIRPGLKTGISIFNYQGDLLSYKKFQFPSIKIMRRQAEAIVKHMEDDLPTEAITHLALVAGDPGQRQIWNKAVTAVSGAPKTVIGLDANEWRRTMLTDEDQKFSQASKTASRTIAQQVISEHGVDHATNRADKLSMEVAESILAGLYVLNNLGMVRKANWTNQHRDAGIMDVTHHPSAQMVP